MRCPVGIVAVLAIAGVAACGTGDQPAGERRATADACALLEAAAPAAGVGDVLVPNGKRDVSLDGFPYSQCDAQASIATMAAVVVLESAARYEQHVQLARGRTVSGLGDGALIEPGISLENKGSSTGATAFVKVGERTVAAAVEIGTDDASDAATQLAREVVKRLP